MKDYAGPRDSETLEAEDVFLKGMVAGTEDIVNDINSCGAILILALLASFFCPVMPHS